jgi:hypothetical protein
LDDQEPITPIRAWTTRPGPETPRETGGRRPEQIAFDRKELTLILGLYGRKVADGEWRDYAMEFGRDKAVFSVFRRSSELPLYRIVKDPALARRQGQYSVVAHGGLILKRGADLAQVLKILIKAPKLTAV